LGIAPNRSKISRGNFAAAKPTGQPPAAGETTGKDDMKTSRLQRTPGLQAGVKFLAFSLFIRY
jgi:hypothetical protein